MSNLKDIKIIYPTEEEINKSINEIKKHTQKKSALSIFLDMYNLFGLRSLFFNKYIYLVYMIFFTSLIYFIKFQEILYLSSEVYTFIIILSPIPFIISLIDFAYIYENKLTDLMGTTKYTIMQMTSYKTLIVSIFAIVINSLVIYQFREQVEVIKAIMFSLNSYFILTSIIFSLIMKIRKRVIQYAIIVLIYTFYMITLLFYSPIIEGLLELSTPYYMILLIVSTSLLLNSTFRYMKKQIEGGTYEYIIYQ